MGRGSTPKLINFDRPGNHFWHFGIALDEHNNLSHVFADASRLCASPYEPLCAGARWRRSAACLPVQGAAPPAASESAATMSGVSFRYSEAGVRKVRRVQFGILGPVELKASSMCNIVTDRTFEKGKPIPGGLMDPALGAIDLLLNCASCGMDSFECPGHFGHLELTKPMYHVSFLITTLKVLRCVCFSCSAILGDQPAEDGKAKLVLVEANAKVDAAEVRRNSRSLEIVPP